MPRKITAGCSAWWVSAADVPEVYQGLPAKYHQIRFLPYEKLVNATDNAQLIIALHDFTIQELLAFEIGKDPIIYISNYTSGVWKMQLSHTQIILAIKTIQTKVYNNLIDRLKQAQINLRTTERLEGTQSVATSKKERKSPQEQDIKDHLKTLTEL